MQSATVTKMGNSAGIAIPARYRMDGCFSVGKKVEISNPRKGVIVLRSSEHDKADRLSRLKVAESRIEARSSQVPEWPGSVSADSLIKNARKDRAHGSISF